MKLSPGSRLGNHEIISVLGSGGMGEVYRARDTKLGREVAIKVLREELCSDSDRLRRFEVEARAASSLNHPNIVIIYGIGTTGSSPFIEMELVSGKTLRRLLDSGPLPPEEILRLVIQVADGLAKAHASGIVHRDLKPENLMVNEDGFVKILDFGLAKLVSQAEWASDIATLGHSATGLVIGTVGYMSPEQASGRSVDFRSDLFSLGSIIYEMATGRRPFHRPTVVQTLSAIIESQPEPLSRINPNLPPSLAATVERLLSKDPVKRHETTRDLLKDLDSAREGGPPLKLQCPGCGRNAPANSLFCSHCGHQLAPSTYDRAPTGVTKSSRRPSYKTPSGPALDGERRSATVLWCNLGGYAEMVEELDPDEFNRFLTRIRDTATEIVTSFGGLVHRFAGDEIVSLFGIPTTQEDDFLRAVRAALKLRELKELTGHKIRVHTGINTGSLVMQRLENGEFQIAGATLQAAERLAGQAEAEEILISPDTRRLIAAFFATEPREPLRLKGRAEPMKTYRVLGESGYLTRLDAAERVGLTALSGREKELETLRECLKKALTGEGQFVTVVGETGLGKSRLLLEFRRGLPSDVEVLQGRCRPPSETRGSYLPFIEVLRDCLDIGEGGVTPSSLGSRLGRIRSIDPALEDFIPLYLHLLSIQSDSYPLPRHLQGEDFLLAMSSGLAAVLTLASHDRPVVVLLQAWHWSDEASRQVLKQLVGMVSAYPMMVLVTYRPESTFDWGNPSHHVPIHLKPLETKESIAIMRSVLGSENFPEELGRLIHEKTGGNPFFIEEVCRTLREEGTLSVVEGRATFTGSLVNVQLPDSVQTVIRTRLDRLDRESREVLRHAAVIGPEFDRQLLERTLSDPTPLSRSLENLKGLGLIQQVRVLPEAVYRFTHALTLQVAYDSLLAHQRKQLHEAVGRAIEDTRPERVEGELDRLAHHFGEAENWARAADYGRRASQRAAGLSQFSEALRLSQQATTWLLRLPSDASRQETRVELLLEQERLSETLGARENQQALIDELLSLLAPAGPSGRLAEVHTRRGVLYSILGRSVEAEEELQKALAIRRNLSDRLGERNTLRSIGFSNWQQGRYQEALGYHETALAISRESGDPVSVAVDLTNLGAVLRSLGRREQALGCLTEALDIFETQQDPRNHQYALHIVASVYRDLGRRDDAMNYFRRALELQSQQHLFLPRTVTLNSIASIHLERGEIEQSLRCYREVVEINRRTRLDQSLATALRTLGALLLSLDRAEEALPYLLESASVFSRCGDRQSEALAWKEVAKIHETRPERREEALAAWEKLRALGREAGDYAGEVEALEAMARLTRSTDGSRALDFYREALDRAVQSKHRDKQGDLLNSMGIIKWTQGLYGEALEYYQRALETFQALQDEVHSGLMLNSIGVTLKALGKSVEAKRHLEEAVHLHQRTGERLLEGHALAALGDVEREMGGAEEALRHYQASLEIRQALGDRKGEGWMLYAIARECVETSRDSCQELLAKATTIATECLDTKLEEACRRLSDLLEKDR